MDDKQKRKEFWERSFLTWQTGVGRRVNLQEYAKYLEVGFTTLSGWINSGYTPAPDVMRRVAAKIGPEIYSVMGVPLDQFEEMRIRLEAAIFEIQQALASRSIDPSSDDGKALAASIFSAWGFSVRVTIADELVTASSKT